MNRIGRLNVPIAVAIGVGLPLCAISISVHAYLAGFEHGDGLALTIGAKAWVFGGSFLLGAIPAGVSARYRVRSPPLVAVGSYVASLATSWSSMVDSARSSGAGITPTVFDLVLPAWIFLLAIALLVGTLEYGIRDALGSRSARSGRSE